MSTFSNRKNKGLDWILLSTYLCILVIGWAVLYATEYTEGMQIWDIEFNSNIGKQTIWVGIALLAFVVSMTLDWKFWASFSLLFYGISLVSLVLLFVFGTTIKGASSWYTLFGLSIQPSEFAKLTTCLALASYLSSPNIKLNNRNQILISIAVLGIPALLIFLQPDAGSALLFSGFLFMLYRAGLSGVYYTILFGLAANFIGSLLFGPELILIMTILAMSFVLASMTGRSKQLYGPLALLSLFSFVFYGYDYLKIILLLCSAFLILVIALNWIEQNLRNLTFVIIIGLLSVFLSYGTNWAFNNILKHHQQERINVWLHPDKSDPRGSLYNILQSKTAIGSGGLAGKGFLEGPMTNLNFVPEQETDFIFSTLGEEQGFLGVLGFIALYTMMLIRIVIIGERGRNNFIRYYAYGIVGLLFFHFFVNIGMTLGIMPVIGIPLAFISKGGSAIVAFSIMLGILLKMDLDRA